MSDTPRTDAVPDAPNGEYVGWIHVVDAQRANGRALEKELQVVIKENDALRAIVAQVRKYSAKLRKVLK
jgi:hypothetical protein